LKKYKIVALFLPKMITIISYIILILATNLPTYIQAYVPPVPSNPPFKNIKSSTSKLSLDLSRREYNDLPSIYRVLLHADRTVQR